MESSPAYMAPATRRHMVNHRSGDPVRGAQRGGTFLAPKGDLPRATAFAAG